MHQAPSTKHQAPGTKHQAPLSLLLFATVIAVYLRTAGYGVVMCDDYEYLEFVRVNGISFTNLSAAIWMPLTWASYALDKALAAGFGLAQFSVMHLHSVLLHALGAVALFHFLRRLAPERGSVLALLAAAVWALHPLRVESVVWIASRKDVLSGLFLIFALTGWVRFRQAANDVRWYVFSVAAFAVAGMAKPSVMTYPCMVALLDLFILKALSVEDIRNRNWKVCVPYVIPCAIAFAIAVTGTYAQNAGGAMEAQVPLWWRLVNGATSLGVYVLNTLWPTALAPQCRLQWPCLPHHCLIGSLTALTIILIITYLLKSPTTNHQSPSTRHHAPSTKHQPPTTKHQAPSTNHQPPTTKHQAPSTNHQPPTTRHQAPSTKHHLTCGLLWFVLVLVPMLGIIGFGKHAFADRFTYLPAIGLSIALLSLSRRVFYPILLVSAVAFAAFTFRQCGFWRDDGSLWARTVEIDGEDNFDAQANLGVYHYEYTHDLKKAVDCFDRAVKFGAEKVDRILLCRLMSLCELGPREAAQQAYYDLGAYDTRKIRRIYQETGMECNATTDYLVGKTIYLHGSDDKDLKAEAEKTLDILLKYNGTGIDVKYAAYLLGRGKKEDIRSDKEDVVIRYRFLK